MTDREELAKLFPPIKRKPITNADRIRSMTDEELACFINEIEAEAIKRAGRYLTKTEIERGKAQRLDWLRQEATDGKTAL